MLHYRTTKANLKILESLNYFLCSSNICIILQEISNFCKQSSGSDYLCYTVQLLEPFLVLDYSTSILKQNVT